jgi:hypothetical protein
MNDPPTLVLVDARRESDTDVSVVVEVDGRRETELFRCQGCDSEIQIWNPVDARSTYEFVELWRYENKVAGQFMGIVGKVLSGERVELPVVLYGRP